MIDLTIDLGYLAIGQPHDWTVSLIVVGFINELLVVSLRLILFPVNKATS